MQLEERSEGPVGMQEKQVDWLVGASSIDVVAEVVDMVQSLVAEVGEHRKKFRAATGEARRAEVALLVNLVEWFVWYSYVDGLHLGEIVAATWRGTALPRAAGTQGTS